MSKRRHTEEQIIRILKQTQSGMKVSEVCREAGISEPTYYKWKSRYGGMEAHDVRRLKQLEDENGRLKQMVAEQALDIQALKAVVEKKW